MLVNAAPHHLPDPVRDIAGMIRAGRTEPAVTDWSYRTETQNRKTPRPGFEPGSKAPQASRMSTTLPGHETECLSPNNYVVLVKKDCSRDDRNAMERVAGPDICGDKTRFLAYPGGSGSTGGAYRPPARTSMCTFTSFPSNWIRYSPDWGTKTLL